MAIKLLFKPARKQTESIIVGNVYCPTSDHEAMNEGITDEMYARTIKEIKRSTDPQTKIIMGGGDFNATIGVREDASNKRYLGQHGLKRRNKNGLSMIQFMRELELRAAMSFFEAKEHCTFVDFRNKCDKKQLDHFLTSQHFGPRVTKAMTYKPPGNLVSDHTAI